MLNSENVAVIFKGIHKIRGVTMYFEHIVIGAGSMGMAAGYFLSKEGGSTLVLDAFNPPHNKGSHHGESRLIRFAYGEGLRYVPFALRAGELWEELEQLVPNEIFRRTGVLNFTPKNDPYMATIIESSVQFNLPLEQLTAAEANERWKGLSLTDDYAISFEPTSGVLMTENIIKSYYELAVKEGATVKGNSRVKQIEPAADSVKVTLEDGTVYTAGSVVISVGAWANQMLDDMGLKLPLTPIRKTFAWYDAPEELYSDAVYPGFAYLDDTVGYYGFPSINGAGLKVGRHDLGDEVNPDEDKIPFGEVTGDQEDLDGFLQKFMPKVGHLKEGKTCMYSMTPDEDFIIDKHPDYPNIAIAAGFSGHGFKFSSAVGEALKDMALQQETKVDLTAFSINRFSK